MNDISSLNRPEFLVGIGASAGGLEALERMFSSMPKIPNVAFVLVQHLSPDFKSLMDELLGRWTDMPVIKAENQMTVEAGMIYLLPPKKEIIISGGKLLLTDKDPKQSLTLPIDHFLRSLAHEYGEQSIAVVLSGTGSDGSSGIEQIHSAGGLVICQNFETAKFDGMPKSAIDTGIVDLVLNAESIGPALETYVKDPDIDAIAKASRAHVEADENEMDSLYRMLQNEYGIDFSSYRISTVSRRIERRLMLNKVSKLGTYLDQLANDPGELDLLYRDLLIGVTQFFRDGEAFATLRGEIQKMLMGKNPGDEVRVWIAGCGTGEEAYSVGIAISEELAKLGKSLFVKIFATDVHQDSLNRASQGVYPLESLADVDQEIRERYFIEVPDGYQVAQEIRQMVVFAPHNVIKDAPFTKLDLISCRNMLIYLETSAQIKVISLFHFGLQTRGLLFLGPSESLGELADEFDVIDSHWKIFQKRRDIRLPHELRLPMGNVPRNKPHVNLTNSAANSEVRLVGIYDAVLDELIDCAFLVNEKRDLLHTFGKATTFMVPKEGRPSNDIVENLVEDLRVSVSTVIHRASHSGKGVELKGVPCEIAGHKMVTNIRSLPITNKKDQSSALLVIIETVKAEEGSKYQDISITSASSEQVLHLETELRFARENLQSMIEELETSNEELQATNEELVAANEELQSTNEELHSVNEELYTVNAEHQKKIQELTTVTRDLDNLLLSTDVHTIFLDRDLCIRKFTPKIAESFNFLEQDIGRRVDSFTHNLKDENLVEHIEEVLKTESPKKFEVQDQYDTWFLMRVLPYRSDEKVDGVVLTLTDITSVKHANMALQESISRRDEFLAMLSHELRNPLGAIMNATYVLDNESSDESARTSAYRVVQRQALQMGALLNDLLDVSRITQKKIRLHCEATDMRESIKAAVESISPELIEGNQVLEINVSDEPIMVYGNPARLQQIMVNLLGNASKYSPAGSKIALSAFSEDEYCYVEVVDQGVGIEQDLIDKIFDMFVQSDATLDRARGGMGVGLTLVRSLVELHNGSITAKSDGPGTGSCFTVRFPLTNISRNPVVPKPHHSKKTGNKIVLIEDNEDACQMLQTILEFDGYDVDVEADGENGLSLILNAQPDLALVDIGLPGKDGYEIARAVRSDSANDAIHLIALTGYGQSTDRQTALEAGFDEHIVKPVDPQKLSKLLGELLRPHMVR